MKKDCYLIDSLEDQAKELNAVFEKNSSDVFAWVEYFLDEYNKITSEFKMLGVLKISRKDSKNPSAEGEYIVVNEEYKKFRG